MKKRILLLLTLTVFACKINAQCTDYVNIPDANFKTSLLNDHTIDLNDDGEISCTEASDYTGTISVKSKSISDLTGIEFFTNITKLYCNSNSLTSLDVSANTALTSLDCNSNSLTSLDVSSNTALSTLYCQKNNLTSLDISNNIVLKYLSCNSNSLTSLDVSNNIVLKHLFFNSNSLTSLDVSNNTALEILYCYGNNLTALDVSNNTALEILYCFGNNLTALDVSNNTALELLFCATNSIANLDVSNNIALENLSCRSNSLTSLDLSSNINLTRLHCKDNNLTSLNIANGNNENLSTNTSFTNFTGNDNLTCIQVDDKDYADANWLLLKDDIASFSEDCGYPLSVNNVFSKTISIYPNPTTDSFTINLFSGLKQVDVFNVIGKKVHTTKSTSVNISHLSSGIYYAKITTETNEIAIKQLIKK